MFSKELPVAIGADHAGFEYKDTLAAYLRGKGFLVKDFGTNGPASVDYPDFAHPTADCVARGEASFGILVCGSANGVAITANKHAEIRAGLCWNTEVASLVRQHNNANVICIPARFVDIQSTLEMVEVFISTAFEGGRHATRVSKISCN